MKSIIFQEEYRLILGWVLATSIGVVLSEEFLTIPILKAIELIFHLDWYRLSPFTIILVSEVTTGILVGTFQWLILRNYIKHNSWWLLVTPLGMILGSYISRFALRMADNNFYLLGNSWFVALWLSRFLYGVIIGSSQWLVLRKSVSKSWVWLIANGLSWSLAITISTEFVRPSIYGYYGVRGGSTPLLFINTYYEIVIYGSLGILVGIITGITLWWLLKQQSVTAQTTAHR
jgi:hypothetical protein